MADSDPSTQHCPVMPKSLQGVTRAAVWPTPDRRIASDPPVAPSLPPDPASVTLPGTCWAIRFVRRDSCAWRLVRVAGDWEPETWETRQSGGREVGETCCKPENLEGVVGADATQSGCVARQVFRFMLNTIDRFANTV